MSAFTKENIAGVGGLMKGIGTDLLSDYIDTAKILHPKIVNGEVLQIVTGNACFRREVLVHVGLFDEQFKLPGGEDTELSIRTINSGYKLAYNVEAVILHNHKDTLRSLLKTMRNYGRGRYLIGTKWPKNRIKYPYLAIVRSIIKTRRAPYSAWKFRKKGGFKRSCLFEDWSLLTTLTFLFGYINGKRYYANS